MAKKKKLIPEEEQTARERGLGLMTPPLHPFQYNFCLVFTIPITTFHGNFSSALGENTASTWVAR